MTRPTRNPKTDVYPVRIAIPPHLRDIIKRDHGVEQEFQRSLGTKVEAEARRLATPVLLEFQNMIAAAEAEYQDKSVRLTDHEISALCGPMAGQAGRTLPRGHPGTVGVS